MLVHLTDADLQKLATVRETILKNVRYHYTIPYLAHAAGLNEFKLKTGFKAVYGQPVFDFLTDNRMKLAVQLLETGNYSVSEIAYRCGYNHPTNFCAAFRRRFQLRPTDYKKNTESKESNLKVVV
jgi:AraC-like DNA-binding protein